jgi:betaine-homocysteine S-methyltransferase
MAWVVISRVVSAKGDAGSGWKRACRTAGDHYTIIIDRRMTTGGGRLVARLEDRLHAGAVICAEGYVFELERRGYVQAGPFVPEVVLEAPDAVAALHREFVLAGSDIVEALTYYGHRDKLRAVGREGDLERLNHAALEIASGVAAEMDALLAGNVSNSHLFEIDDAGTHDTVRMMLREQIEWAREANVDFVIAETFPFYEEALIAVQEVKRVDLPCVVTLAIFREPATFDGLSVADACRRLADAGADVVGLNCMRGPRTMLPLLAEIVQAVDVPVAALPVPYRTTDESPAFVSLCDSGYPPAANERAFPTALDPFVCNRYEIADFTLAARELGVRYFGLCCGAGPHHIRSMAEALGRTPPASRYSPNMEKHGMFGSAPRAVSARGHHEQRL